MKCEKGLHFRHVEMLLLLFLLAMHTGVRKHILILQLIFLEFFGFFFRIIFITAAKWLYPYGFFFKNQGTNIIVCM